MDQSALVIAAVGGLGLWAAVSYIRHYLSQCSKCKGSGKVYSGFWPGQYRPCPRCKRKGEVSHGFGPKG
ncbi:hypothetical protein [Microbispora amethystogenes]|uniref:Uncharacterized protein n=1 Tax=Microbispora amethystogenes TaxID=1427754 RepID=A0ABQ4FHP6_9ACTN|nr:hypothetical protein [Microbispora amethystogenes]GIH34354.1 hypothetical protein Mam01_45180 [Microbispora amethystogenes]